MEPFISCEGLVKIYQVADIEMVALQGLNITINRGELLSVVGASGSGKTTLMSILGGLDRPTAGKVMVNGQNLLKMPDRQLNRYRREQVGFVWQQSARNLVPYLNAIQNVILPMTLAGSAQHNNRQKASELLEIVGLGERKTHKLPELSGGEQQRVAIAVALANDPILLLADEPTGEVDSTTAGVIYGTFQMLAHEMGVTTLIVSHDPGIARHVDRVVRIRDGMLATETRRQVRSTTNGSTETDTQSGDAVEEEYEELVVVDNAGRLHIPQDYLEELAFQNHATIEMTEDGILIKPMVPEAAARGGASDAVGDAAGDADGESDTAQDADAADATPKRGRGLFGRFRRRKQSD